jgi:hypothetical protein
MIVKENIRGMKNIFPKCYSETDLCVVPTAYHKLCFLNISVFLVSLLKSATHFLAIGSMLLILMSISEGGGLKNLMIKRSALGTNVNFDILIITDPYQRVIIYLKLKRCL